jgi:DNA-binding XRE family transcriptional regulator
MTRRASSAGKAATGLSAWPERLIVASYRPDGDELSLGFEGGRVVHVSLRRLGIQARPRFVFAAPDEFGSGVVLFREDGSRTDCGVDWVLQRAGEGGGEEQTAGEDLAARVAARLKAFRERSGTTQREMARLLDMAPPNYNRLEAGRHRPTADTLLRIAEVMGISLGRLVQG